MLRLGCIVLSIWALLNLLPSLLILASTAILNGDSPAIFQILNDQEVAALTAKERTSINSVAAYANGLNVAFCVMALFVIWFGLNRRSHWSFWCLVFGFVFALLAGILGDFILGTVHPEINAISSVIVLVGCVLAAIDLFRRNGRAEGGL